MLGPPQFENDPQGAVLCIWGLYLELTATVSVCKLPRTATDDAMDAAIVSMDAFIKENSSLHPTTEMLEDFKARATAHVTASSRVCLNPDITAFRAASPQDIREGTARLLAVPREPVMNPCF